MVLKKMKENRQKKKKNEGHQMREKKRRNKERKLCHKSCLTALINKSAYTKAWY